MENFCELKYPVKYLDTLVKDLENGLNEFSKQPVKYTVKAVRDFIVDYYDMAGSAIAGFAWKDYGGEVTGDLRWPLAFIGVGAALIGPKIEHCLYGRGTYYYEGSSMNRALRNFAAGMAVAGYKEAPYFTNKIAGVVIGAASLLMNDCLFKNRGAKNIKNTDSAWEAEKEEILKRVELERELL